MATQEGGGNPDVKEVGGNSSANVNILQMKMNTKRARFLDTTNDWKTSSGKSCKGQSCSVFWGWFLMLLSKSSGDCRVFRFIILLGATKAKEVHCSLVLA